MAQLGGCYSPCGLTLGFSVTGMQPGWFGEFRMTLTPILRLWWEQWKSGLSCPLPPPKLHTLEALPWALSSRLAGFLTPYSRLPQARWKMLVLLTSRCSSPRLSFYALSKGKEKPSLRTNLSFSVGQLHFLDGSKSSIGVKVTEMSAGAQAAQANTDLPGGLLLPSPCCD